MATSYRPDVRQRRAWKEGELTGQDTVTKWHYFKGFSFKARVLRDRPNTKIPAY